MMPKQSSEGKVYESPGLFGWVRDMGRAILPYVVATGVATGVAIGGGAAAGKVIQKYWIDPVAEEGAKQTAQIIMVGADFANQAQNALNEFVHGKPPVEKPQQK